MPAQLQSLTTLGAVDAAAWNALAGGSPFLRHEFLYALERSGCIGPGTAWQPCYVVARDDRGLAGALPHCITYDSHGEFVFDWGWADAYERTGRNY
jgi:predicted N-acyltransferase